MHQAPDLGDEVRYRAQLWTVTKVTGSRVELRRGGGYTAYQYATAHHRELRFERAGSSRWKRPAEPEPFDADGFVRAVVAGAVERAQDAAEAYHVANPLLTAYHEGAHAIVADAYGMELIGAWADPSSDRARQGQTDYFAWGSTDLARVESAVVALAGKVGERMCPAWRDDQDLVSGHHDDLDQARAVLGDDPAVIRAMEDQARAILTERAGTLEHLAELLVARGADGVKGAELERILSTPRTRLPSQREDRGHAGQPMTHWSDRARHGHWCGRSVPCPPGCAETLPYTSAPPPAGLRDLMDRARSAERAGGAYRAAPGWAA
ncbi:hypothetical protein [Frankia sp. EAN1pec]|uniref:hypothetical protein n=1 Tax=Parafrankia sp. (strain EAN1pec) TaxID=298653 RepID=UPI0002F1EB71